MDMIAPVMIKLNLGLQYKLIC